MRSLSLAQEGYYKKIMMKGGWRLIQSNGSASSGIVVPGIKVSLSATEENLKIKAHLLEPKGNRGGNITGTTIRWDYIQLLIGIHLLTLPSAMLKALTSVVISDR